MVNQLLETSHPFLPPLYVSVSRWLPRLPFLSLPPYIITSLLPLFRTHFQVPYPATPLFATLTKTPGVSGHSSHFGTGLQSVPHAIPARIPRSGFAFSTGREILRANSYCPVFSFVPSRERAWTKGHGVVYRS